MCSQENLEVEATYWTMEGKVRVLDWMANALAGLNRCVLCLGHDEPHPYGRKLLYPFLDLCP